MLRHRAARRHAGEKETVREQLGETDRNGKLAAPVAPLANWATAQSNKPVRKVMEAIAGVDRGRPAADLPLPDGQPPAARAPGAVSRGAGLSASARR